MYAPTQLLSASRQNLWRLTLIRILVLAAQAGSVGFAYLSDLLPLPWLPLSITLGLSALLCAFTWLRLKGPWPVTEQEYAVQLACDLIIHSVLLFYAGGSTNPFVSYYLVPLTIAAATLPWLYSMALSGLALTGYTALLIWYHPLELHGIEHEATLISLHLFGMWLNFALSAAFITFFVVKMAGALRRQDQLQAERREEGMRDQQLLAVATQAAGAGGTQGAGTPAGPQRRQVVRGRPRPCRLPRALPRLARAGHRLGGTERPVARVGVLHPARQRHPTGGVRRHGSLGGRSRQDAPFH